MKIKSTYVHLVIVIFVSLSFAENISIPFDLYTKVDDYMYWISLNVKEIDQVEKTEKFKASKVVTDDSKCDSLVISLKNDPVNGKALIGKNIHISINKKKSGTLLFVENYFRPIETPITINCNGKADGTKSEDKGIEDIYVQHATGKNDLLIDSKTKNSLELDWSKDEAIVFSSYQININSANHELTFTHKIQSKNSVKVPAIEKELIIERQFVDDTVHDSILFSYGFVLMDANYQNTEKLKVHLESIDKAVKALDEDKTRDTVAHISLKNKILPTYVKKSSGKGYAAIDAGVTKGEIRIDSVAFVFANGLVQEIVAFGFDTLNNKTVEFQNRYPYSLTTIKDYNKVQTGTSRQKWARYLWEKLSSKSKKESRLIELKDVVDFKRLSNLVSKTYIPANQALVAKKDTTVKVLKRSSRASLNLRTYSDLLGFKEDNANSLFNVDLTTKFIGFTKPIGNWQVFNEFNPYFSYSSIKDGEQLLGQVDANNNGALNSITTFEAVKNKRTKVGVDIDIVKYSMSFAHLKVSADAGLITGLMNVIDTNSADPENIAYDTANVVLNTPFLHLVGQLHMNVTESFSFDVSAGVYPKKATKLFKDKKSWKDISSIPYAKTNVFDFAMQINYEKSDISDLFLRFNFLSGKDSSGESSGFHQFEIGTTTSLSNVIKYLGQR